MRISRHFGIYAGAPSGGEFIVYPTDINGIVRRRQVYPSVTTWGVVSRDYTIHNGDAEYYRLGSKESTSTKVYGTAQGGYSEEQITVQNDYIICALFDLSAFSKFKKIELCLLREKSSGLNSFSLSIGHKINSEVVNFGMASEASMEHEFMREEGLYTIDVTSLGMPEYGYILRADTSNTGKYYTDINATLKDAFYLKITT